MSTTALLCVGFASMLVTVSPPCCFCFSFCSGDNTVFEARACCCSLITAVVVRWGDVAPSLSLSGGALYAAAAVWEPEEAGRSSAKASFTAEVRN